jgi:hypothetical protein
MQPKNAHTARTTSNSHRAFHMFCSPPGGLSSLQKEAAPPVSIATVAQGSGQIKKKRRRPAGVALGQDGELFLFGAAGPVAAAAAAVGGGEIDA